jgi:hypothetical protein
MKLYDNARVIQSVMTALTGIAGFAVGMWHGAETGEWGLAVIAPMMFVLAIGYDIMGESERRFAEIIAARRRD